jgi:UDP-glucose 4-epimerase
MNVLLTGGTGYIGSHTAVSLLQANHQVVLLDNLSNSNAGVVNSIKAITNKNPAFVEGDIRDTALLVRVINSLEIGAVMHFAGLKAVGESVSRPLDYFNNNVGGTLSLLHAMEKTGVNKLVFSSSATVYGKAQYLPIDEKHPTSVTNPYGRTKLHTEEILKDLALANSSLRFASLRYFNPAGAHESGLIGESPGGIPNNLMPYIAAVAAGQQPHLEVFGNDYNTPDGTGVRDYIHVMDLAEGHVAALNHLFLCNERFDTFNLGTGQGCSVLQMIRTFEKVCGTPIPYKFAPRRPGDIATCYANPAKAHTTLHWQAKRTLNDMCASMWKFQTGAHRKQP